MLASLSDSLHLNVWFPQTIARAGCPPCISAMVSTFVCQVFLRVLIPFLYHQEDSEKTGKATSAGMYFLHFQVYRMDSTVNAVC
ncbi:hypothetical protein GW17_00047497 [Ensete ventricosum]|nr:hypothetical protein GW17_00047497 [Ensete ventricosum]